ncbi:hypothetical protein BD311DRAFT_50994 [Dichomitus squalens]|uniref:Uncharacterized protein n=1 Tax=Dichomitus squalens TaxID=114155 RepID=A0A4Q9MVI4_9APHY|nr:hypothetical protein BD311DRAFT_50994 [Dichomitus squalens]
MHPSRPRIQPVLLSLAGHAGISNACGTLCTFSLCSRTGTREKPPCPCRLATKTQTACACRPPALRGCFQPAVSTCKRPDLLTCYLVAIVIWSQSSHTVRYLSATSSARCVVVGTDRRHGGMSVEADFQWLAWTGDLIDGAQPVGSPVSPCICTCFAFRIPCVAFQEVRPEAAHMACGRHATNRKHVGERGARHSRSQCDLPGLCLYSERLYHNRLFFTPDDRPCGQKNRPRGQRTADRVDRGRTREP